MVWPIHRSWHCGHWAIQGPLYPIREQGNQSFAISSTESLDTSAISFKVYPFAFSLLAMARASSFLPSFLPLIIPCSLSRSLIISSTPMSMFLFESCVISLSNLRFKTRIINVQTTLEENTGQHLPYHDQCSIGGISCPFINDQATPIKEWPGQYIDIGIVAIGQYRALYIQLREQG